MARLAKERPQMWVQPSSISNHKTAPPQVNFYAFLAVAYLLLIAGGMLAVCLSIASQSVG